MSLPHDDVAKEWREARAPVRGVHTDTAACGRPSLATIDTAAHHMRREAEIGGYVAEAEVEPVTDAGRALLGRLLGRAAGDVCFVESAELALHRVLRAWPARPGATVAALPGEYGPNLAAFAAHGLRVIPLPADGAGRLDVAAAERSLREHRPDLVHLTVVASHRGLLQPAADLAAVCRAADLPLVVDAAQGLGHIDCRLDVDAIYAPSRKWLTGPRGVGVLAVSPDCARRLRVPGTGEPLGTAQGLEAREGSVAGRLGLIHAVGELFAGGPAKVFERLAAIGRLTREVLDGAGGWRVVEPIGEPTAVTTLVPPGGTDVFAVRAQLVELHGIVTTACGIERAPGELRDPVLRISPHIDAEPEQLEQVRVALADA
jgi:pyridoxal 5-phosphate dependent beta-lyase